MPISNPVPPKGWLMSPWLAPACGAALALAFVVLWYLMAREEQDHIAQALAAQSERLQTRISLDLERRTLSLARIAERWNRRGGTPRTEWEGDVSLYLAQQPGYRGIERLDADDQRRWLVTPDSNPGVIPPADALRSVLARARESAVPRILTLEAAPELLAIVVPVLAAGVPDGHFIAHLDLSRWLDYVLRDTSGGQFAVTIVARGRTVFENRAEVAAFGDAWVKRSSLTIGDAELAVTIRPQEGFFGRPRFLLPGVVLAGGLMLSILFAAAILFGQRARRQGLALAENERRFTEFLEHTPAAVYMKDRDGRYLFVNQRFRDWYCTDYEVLGKTCADLFPRDAAVKYADHDREVTDQGRALRREEQVRHRDGSLHPTEVNVFPIFDNAGVLRAIGGVNIEISDRRTAEKTQARLAAIIESTDDAVYSKDLDGIILSWNPAAERLYGYSVKEAVGMPVSRLAPDGRKQEIQWLLDKAVRGERVRQFETVRLRKDGIAVDVEITMSPLMNSAGEVEAASVLARDVTARKDAERRMQLFVEAAPAGMVMVDEAGTILLANTTAADMFGYEQKALSGMAVEKLIPDRFRNEHPKYRAMFHDDLQARAMGAGRDLWGLRSDGSEFPIEIGLNPTRSAGRTLVLCAVVDITERKRIEDQLERQRAELARSNEELERFAQMASHDLQEPLRLVVNFSQLLDRRYRERLDDDGREFIGYLTENAGRMRQMIQDLLEYARLGRKQTTPDAVDMNVVMNEVRHNLRLALEENNAVLDIDALPRVRVDRVEANRLLQNLIENALKYRGDAAPVIRVSAQQEGEGRWRFDVTDNGIGIDPRHRESIFEPFERLHSRARYPGTGMGLAVCRRIVERHGGRIWVKSDQAPGVTFCFTLPGEDL